MIERIRNKEWERINSSLAKINPNVSYEECRRYACEDIIKNLTTLPKNLPSFYKLSKEKDFHFIGRVDTQLFYDNNDLDSYLNDFYKRSFASFSIVNNKNISRYKGRYFYIYDIQPTDIVHIFPLDSDSQRHAEKEEELTWMPSLWLTLDDLENLSRKLAVYNQITCKTSNIGKPIAILGFNQEESDIRDFAKKSRLSYILVHSDEDAVDYDKDLLYDFFKLKEVSTIIESQFGFKVSQLYYTD